MTNIFLIVLQASIVLVTVPVFLGGIFWISARLRKQTAPAPWTMYRAMVHAGIHEANTEQMRHELPWSIASVGVLMALLLCMPLLTVTPLLPGIANPITIVTMILTALVLGVRERSRHSTSVIILLVLTFLCAFLSLGLAASSPLNVMDLLTAPRVHALVPLLAVALGVLALWRDAREAHQEPTHAVAVVTYIRVALLGIVLGVFITHLLLPFGIVHVGAPLRDIAVGVAMLLVRMVGVMIVLGVVDGVLSAQRYFTAPRIALGAAAIAIIELIVTIILIFV